MSRFRKVYLNLPLKYKLLYFFIPLSILPILIITIFSTHEYKNTIYKRTFSNLNNNSQLIVNQIEGLLSDAVNCSNMLTININNVIEKEKLKPSRTNQSLYNSISNELAYGKLIFNDIDSIAFLDIKNTLHYTHPNLAIGRHKIHKSHILNEVSLTNGISIWFNMEKRTFLSTDSNEPLLTLGKKVVDIDTGKTLGYLFININQSTLSSIFKNQDNNYFIIDESNKIISSTNEDLLLKTIKNGELKKFINSSSQSQIIKINDIDMIITNNPFKNFRWNLISEVRLTEVMHDLDKTNFILLILVVALISFEVFICTSIAYLITNPMDKLKVGMKKISAGDFDINIDVTSKDEVGVFAEGFNKMAGKIRALLKNVEKEQKTKHEYQLALIQSQVKPHFLYNCLDVIYTLSDMGKIKQAKKSTKTLADFYRGTLSSGTEIITIKDEIKIVKDYLSLIQYQYSDVFNYEIHIEDEILNFNILKLTLQPLVENAIYHGLKPCDEFGDVIIKGFMENEKIILKVIDNGIGIPPDKLKELQDSFEKGSKEHYGLYNVQDRIKLFFGNNSSFIIESKKNEGTTITITLPAKEGADKDD